MDCATLSSAGIAVVTGEQGPTTGLADRAWLLEIKRLYHHDSACQAAAALLAASRIPAVTSPEVTTRLIKKRSTWVTESCWPPSGQREQVALPSTFAAEQGVHPAKAPLTQACFEAFAHVAAGIQACKHCHTQDSGLPLNGRS